MLAEGNSSDVSDSINKNLDPIGKTHIPIGIPDTLDTLKTLVEAEGCFSPGVGSYGIYFWIFDHQKRFIFDFVIIKKYCLITNYTN